MGIKVEKDANNYFVEKKSGIKCENHFVDIYTWQLPDRFLISIENSNSRIQQNIELYIDLDSLGLIPKLPWQEFIGIRDLWGSRENSQPATLNYHNRKIEINELYPNETRLIALRLY